MDAIWLLEGPHEAAGWGALERDARGEKLDVLIFDRDAWALIRAPAPPTAYAGLAPRAAPDGLYLDNQGRRVYLAGGRQVPDAGDVLATLGQQAQDLLQKLGDPDIVLERLGLVH